VIRPVTWTASFATDTAGVSVKWQWSAAVYRTFSTDYAALGVKPLDGRRGTIYRNADNAGTPENFKSFVRAGARGDGRPDYTGSYSRTVRVRPAVEQPPPPPPAEPPPVPPPPPTGSLSGHVYFDVNANGLRDAGDSGIAGVTLLLRDSNGTLVAQTTTDANGFYSFAGLAAATYTISEVQPNSYDQATNNLGSLGGTLGFDALTVALTAGANGTDYNFGELFSAGGE
jgi:hypothetical protein